MSGQYQATRKERINYLIMNNTIEFILRLKDLMSGSMAQANASAQRNLNTTARTVLALQGRFGDTRSIATMERAMRMLERRRHLSIDTSEIARANSQINTLRSRMNSLNGGGRSASGGSSGGGGGMMGSFIGGNLVAGAISQGVGFIKDQAMDTFKTAMKMDGLRTAINSTTGGQGKEAVGMTESISKKYGLDYESSLEGVKTLTGGLKGMNIPLQEQMRIFEGVSTGIAAMKLGAEESKGAMLALGQMASKGTVSAEELRGQLGERIPGAFGVAARAMNMTEAQLGKMMQKGELSAKEFLPKFASQMEKENGAAALAAAKGPQALMNNLNTEIVKIKDVIGGGLISAIMPFVEKFTYIAQVSLPYIKESISWIVNGISELMTGTGGWSDYIAIAKDYFMGIWVVAKRIVGNVLQIVKGIFDWVGKSELLKDIFWVVQTIALKVWDVVSWVVDKIKWVWDNVVKPILDALETAYVWLKDLVGGDKSIQINHTVSDGRIPFATMPAASGANYINGNPLVTTALYKKPPESIFGTSSQNSVDGSAASSEGATHSGPRTITVNFNKEMFGSLSINSMNVKEGVGEMEDMIREAVFRLFGSLKSAQ